MKKYFTKQTVGGYMFAGVALFALLAMILFVVSGVTGFWSGREVSALAVVFMILGLIFAVALFLFSDKFGKVVTELLMLATIVLLTAALGIGIIERLDLFADIYFIPVNHPEAEETSLAITLAGFVFEILAIVVAVVASFFNKLVKES